MPTTRKQIDDYTEQVITEKLIAIYKPLGPKGVQKIWDLLGILNKDLPALIHIDDLHWELLEPDDQVLVGDYIEKIVPLSEAMASLSKQRREEIYKQVKLEMYGGKRQWHSIL